LNNQKTKYSTIDIFSELARLHRIYSILAAICGSLTFWRILHFFQFSLRLSALTEVLVMASTDIYHFLLMFALLLISFAIIATAYFGENIIYFTDIFSSLVQLVKMMSTVFDYTLFTSQPHHSLFLILFTLTFNLLLLNLLTSIIIVHYLNYRRSMTELFKIRADLNKGRSFTEIVID